MRFPTLFSPLLLNGMMTKNRIVATPTGEIFEDKALGGAGIVIAGHAIVEPGHSSYSSADEPDAFFKYEVEDTRRRVLKIHQAGARASIEIFHAGEFARAHGFVRGPVSKTRDDGLEIRGMTEADMEHVLELYKTCVRNAKDVGFDMVFLHFGHGWLPAQFLSPRNNKRTDEYGGSLENRARFPLRILAAVREAVGPDFPVDMRISAHEWVADSIAFEDVVAFLKMAEPYLDTVQISAGLDIGIEGNVHMATTNFEEHMPNAHWAAEVKRTLSIPVGVVGAIMSPEEAEGLLASGAVDLVALGRPLIADPNWPRKAQEGREDEIVPCIRCLQCYHIASDRRNVGCSVNPRYTNESFVPKTLTIAPRPRRMVVVGGGPGGITAALAASERGHEVTLIDRNEELGGLMRYISREHYKRDIKSYHEYLLGRVAKSRIDVQLGVEATPESVAAMGPDILVLALGAKPVIPRIPGVDLPHVFDGNQAIERESEIGDRVVVLGSGSVGAEIGLELASLHGKDVTIVDRGTTFARRNNKLYREGLRQKLVAADTLEMVWESTCEEITPEHVAIRGKDGEIRLVPADHVILSAGMRPLTREAQAYFGITPEIAMIGDCVRPRIIMDAVFEGHTYAMNV
ncbi:FAD-dependent oxidoreductase [Herbiconiux sp. L3-i23]|uniref:oxidoreductase n=1 Tax=Herbiconiux sp. L3-i23 TaxID=2905871 RepID=UPI002063676B|nr:FAD-dependent oxidoreductase [Herbiconiux sp. L3-i23]BDI22588.1 NADH oxidase [Herbiconiux sp. L3-i23]